MSADSIKKRLEDGKILVGFIHESVLAGDFIAVNGGFSVKIAAGKTVVLHGRGRVWLLTGETCIAISEKGAIIIDHLYCEKALLIGIQYPVIARYVKTLEAYTRRVHIGELNSSKWVASSMSNVDKVSVATALFMDPHSHISEIEYMDSIHYGY
ncbi:MAG: hypothetical protein ACP5N5_05545 [Desulfurococcus sp.]|uniref:hypothetical protein n=1 Tax=Desulfurococcus sp. TaxID=51678 RepID=UPI003D141241